MSQAGGHQLSRGQDLRLRLLFFLLASIFLTSLAPTVASASWKSQMRSQINAARASQGLAPVKAYKPLRRSSTRYATFMVANDVWAHAANPASGSRLGWVGEILGMTTTADPAPRTMVDAWLASPVHRPILLNARYRYVGMGLEHGSMDGVTAWVWVVRFGAK
jgi:uncharacterized protein YkwD